MRLPTDGFSCNIRSCFSLLNVFDTFPIPIKIEKKKKGQTKLNKFCYLNFEYISLDVTGNTRFVPVEMTPYLLLKANACRILFVLFLNALVLFRLVPKLKYFYL